jgi:hypothetical protein
MAYCELVQGVVRDAARFGEIASPGKGWSNCLAFQAKQPNVVQPRKLPALELLVFGLAAGHSFLSI